MKSRPTGHQVPNSNSPQLENKGYMIKVCSIEHRSSHTSPSPGVPEIRIYRVRIVSSNLCYKKLFREIHRKEWRNNKGSGKEARSADVGDVLL